MKTSLPASADLFHEDISCHHSGASCDPPCFLVSRACLGPPLHVSLLLLAIPALVVASALLRLVRLTHNTLGTIWADVFPSRTRFMDAASPPSAGPGAVPHLVALFSVMSLLVPKRSFLGQAGGLTWRGESGVLPAPPGPSIAGRGLISAVSVQVIMVGSVFPRFSGGQLHSARE